MARKKATKQKCKSRIPGVSVGQVVGTCLGATKKVCFRIGGKTFFRMVDPDWQAPGRYPLARPGHAARLLLIRGHAKNLTLQDKTSGLM